MKLKLTLHREYVLDLSAAKNADVANMLLEMYNEGIDDPIDDLADADPDELHDVVKQALADDINNVVDLDLDDGDFEIEVIK